MDSMLSTRALSKTYAVGDVAVHALRGVDVAVDAGEFVAVTGPSGCGKSTLLNLLGGLDRPSDGEVWLAGRRVDELSEARWAVVRRRQFGFVFQFFNLIGNLSVRDNVEVPALLAGVSPREARRRRERLFADLGLPDDAGAVPAQLSGGEQQRVAIARALINEPKVLLADEPTGNLDSRSARDVVGVLKTFHARGQTIVLVTHDPRVASAADRVLSLRDGCVAGETRMEGVERSPAALSSLMQLEV
jgi:putative ABC transport system ATP-binding protein